MRGKIMSKYKNYLLFLAILAIAGTIIGSRARAWKEPAETILPVAINLSEIARNPHALKDKSVTFIARFAARGSMFREKDPVFTAESYENFSVWNKEVKFWEKTELKKVYPTLYVAKESTQLINILRTLNQFARIEVTGVVESLYANMPWIRVSSIRVLTDDDLDQSMASQVSRGIQFIANQEFQKARICFEIAQERRTPRYVSELISQKLTEITEIKRQAEITARKELAKDLLNQARNLAKTGNFEKAATTYGKALKASGEYNSSADIHKEIAGFFIDFYRQKNEKELLEYSSNEFHIAQKLLGQPDSDIYYALAYIEKLKAKTTRDYRKAEALARKCLEVNSRHYSGRKLLSDILSCELTSRKDSIEEIILPVAPKKRIKLPHRVEVDDEDILVEIEDLIKEKELTAMEDEASHDTENLTEMFSTRTKNEMTVQTKKTDVKYNHAPEPIPGISVSDFDQVLADIESNLTQIDLNEEKNATSQTPDLPDFPIDASESRLPDLAL